jgi:hypothetical protein
MKQLAAVIITHTIENIMVQRQVLKLGANLVSANAPAELSRRIRSDNKNRIISYFAGKPESIRIRTAVAGQAKLELQRLLELIREAGIIRCQIFG